MGKYLCLDKGDCTRYRTCAAFRKRQFYRNKYNVLTSVSDSFRSACRRELSRCVATDENCKKNVAAGESCTKFHRFRARSQCVWREFSALYHQPSNVELVARCPTADALKDELTKAVEATGASRQALLQPCHLQSLRCKDQACIEAAEASMYCQVYSKAQRESECAKEEFSCEFGTSRHQRARACSKMSTDCKA